MPIYINMEHFSFEHKFDDGTLIIEFNGGLSFAYKESLYYFRCGSVITFSEEASNCETSSTGTFNNNPSSTITFPKFVYFLKSLMNWNLNPLIKINFKIIRPDRSLPKLNITVNIQNVIDDTVKKYTACIYDHSYRYNDMSIIRTDDLIKRVHSGFNEHAEKIKNVESKINIMDTYFHDQYLTNQTHLKQIEKLESDIAELKKIVAELANKPVEKTVEKPVKK